MSGKVGLEKPDPGIFHVAFERLGIGPETSSPTMFSAHAAPGCRHALTDPLAQAIAMRGSSTSWS